MYKRVLFIAIGGLLGTLARYGTSTLLKPASDRGHFPFGTLAVNLLGCFIMGVLQGFFMDRMIREEYRFGLLVGFLGGYTTFSSFAWETTALLQDRQWMTAALNIGANNVLGVALVIFGFFIGRRA